MKWKDVLQKIRDNVGWILVVAASTIFLIVTVVFVIGLKNEERSMEDALIPAIISAAFTFFTTMSFKIQGGIDAKKEYKALVDEYYSTNTKDKKPHKRWKYWLITMPIDVITKAGSIGLGLASCVYFCVEGSKDWLMILLAFGTIIGAVGLGIFTMKGSYDDWVENMPLIMQNAIDERNKEN